MPDWHRIVSSRLVDLALEDREREEVFTELANHLEEAYQAMRLSGFTEPDAVDHALAQVRDWNDLQRRIYFARKENTMTLRAARVWLPSLVTLFLSTST